MSEAFPDVPDLTRIDTAHATTAFSEWLPQRRWFQGKARTIVDVRPRAVLDLGGELVDLIIDVTYDDEEMEHYQIPVITVTGHEDGGVLALTTTDGQEILVADALSRPATARRYAELIVHGVEYDAGDMGVVRGLPVTPSGTPLAEQVRVMRGEQSNTSVVFGDTLILKVLRRLESGEHPDIELTRGLTEAGFPHIPAQVGSLILFESGWPTALAVLSQYVAGATDGWEWAVAETSRIAQGGEADPGATNALTALGEAVGLLHRTMERTFTSHAAGPAELTAWSHGMREQLTRVLALARDRTPDAVRSLDDIVDDLWRVIDELQGMPLSEIGPMTRIHGDLHLGQTLLHPESGWQLLDFEGEPAKPIEERRRPSSPLRDVAGMVRSFDYAAASGALAAGQSVDDLPDELIAWRESARTAFIDGYTKSGPDALMALDANAIVVTAFELDKAIYELGYELANRPSWVPIPVSGIVRAVHRYQASDRYSDPAG